MWSLASRARRERTAVDETSGFIACGVGAGDGFDGRKVEVRMDEVEPFS